MSSFILPQIKNKIANKGISCDIDGLDNSERKDLWIKTRHRMCLVGRCVVQVV
jgi:hypothetical protein